MLRHIVMWKLKAEAEGRGKEANAQRMKEALEALPSKIPEILRLEVGLDIKGKDGSYDIVLIVDLEDERALATYQEHPDHVKVAQMISGLRESRAVVDYLV